MLFMMDERYVEISLREGREMRLKRSSCREDSQAARRYGGARHTLIALRTPPALAGAASPAADERAEIQHKSGAAPRLRPHTHHHHHHEDAHQREANGMGSLDA